jgi:hypothetical protein
MAEPENEVCRVVQGILTLFEQGHPSAATKEVGDHIRACGDCRQVARRVRQTLAARRMVLGSQGT